MFLKKLACSVALITTFSMGTLALADNSKLIVGTWNCDFALEQDGMTITMQMKNKYSNDATGTSDATATMVAPQLGLDLAFEVEAQSTWVIEGDQLSSTVTGGSVTSLKPSIYDSMLNDNDLLPIGTTEQSTIVELNASTLKLSSQGQEITCTK